MRFEARRNVLASSSCRFVWSERARRNIFIQIHFPLDLDSPRTSINLPFFASLAHTIYASRFFALPTFLDELTFHSNKSQFLPIHKYFTISSPQKKVSFLLLALVALFRVFFSIQIARKMAKLEWGGWEEGSKPEKTNAIELIFRKEVITNLCAKSALKLLFWLLKSRPEHARRWRRWSANPPPVNWVCCLVL